MVEILQNKNSATRFQILVEIAASGHSIQQKSIAVKLGVTPQAISDYIRQLVRFDRGAAVTLHNINFPYRFLTHQFWAHFPLPSPGGLS